MFLLNMSGKTPIYEQIKEEIHKFIEAGILKPGDRLPSVRALAQENGINPNTVAKAYSQLEAEGIVCNIPKKGVYVAGEKTGSRKERLLSMIQGIRDAGYSREEISQAAAEVFKEDEHAEN